MAGYGKSLIIAVGILLYLAILFLLNQSHRHNQQALETEVQGRLQMQAQGLRAALLNSGQAEHLFDSENELAADVISTMEQVFKMENITLLSELNTVIHSSNPFMEQGEQQHLELSEKDSRGLAEGKIVMRPLVNIQGSLFRTLYIPLNNEMESGLLSIDVDLSYLERGNKFQQRYYLALGVSLFLFLGGMLVILYILNRWEVSEKERAGAERLALMGKMTASIAHEIKNPLGIIKSTADMIEKKYSDPQKKDEIFGYIGEEVDRLNQSITDYLTYSKDITVRPEKMDIDNSIDKILKDFPTVVFERGNVGQFSYDPFRFTQLLRNLILNGQLHGGNQVHITTLKKGTDAQMNLWDGGQGIPAEQMARVFEPFNSTSSNGTGLGLSIVKKIAELHGGNISVTNHPERGASFTLHIKGQST